MESTGKAGIATFVMREREYLVAIIAENGVLRAETMRFADEIRSAEDVGLPKRPKVDKKDVRRLSKAIAGLFEKELDPDELEDRRSRGIEKLVRSKLSSGRDVVKAPVEEERTAPGVLGSEERLVIDLMEELKRRMKGGEAPSGDAGKSRRPVSKTSSASDLESHSKQELYAMAQDLDLEGRSKMSKQELVRAIARSRP
jgi:DNA end-binding protein Ku